MYAYTHSAAGREEAEEEEPTDSSSVWGEEEAEGEGGVTGAAEVLYGVRVW